MTALAITNKGRRTSGGFFVIVLLMALFAIAIQYGLHGQLRHGAEAEAVRQCLGSDSPKLHLTRPSDGREAFLCQLRDGSWGIEIFQGDKEITAFIRRIGDKAVENLDLVREYMARAGYR